MYWPQLIGDVEIRERRPRSWNEPRYKRLSFVKERRTSPSSQWALTPVPYRRQLSQAEMWDLRQAEAARRFQDQDIRARQIMLDQDRQRYMLQYPPQHHHGDPRIQPIGPAPPPHHGPGSDHHGHHDDHRGHHDDHFGHEDHHGHHDDHHHGGDDDIIEILSDGSSSDDQSRRSIRLILAKPSKEKLPKEYHHKKDKKDKKKKKKKTKKHSPPPSDSEDSSDSDNFIKGYMAGRKRSGSRSRAPSSRGRSKSRLWELSDDSFEDLEFRLPVRSRSRGPRRR